MPEIKSSLALAFFGIGLLTLPLQSAKAEDQILTGAEESDTSPEHGKINTPDATPVETGHFEIEGSYSYSSSSRAWNNGGTSLSTGYASAHEAGLSLTAGLASNLDATLEIGYDWLKDKGNDFDDDGIEGPINGNGFAPVDLSGRYRFYHNEANALDLAYSAGLSIPTGNESDEDQVGTSSAYWILHQTVAASKDWGHWTANADLGYAQAMGKKKDGLLGTFNADLAGGYQILPWLQPELELNYSHDIVANEEDSEVWAMTAGLVMPLNDQLRLNVGLQQGLLGRNAAKETAGNLALKVAF